MNADQPRPASGSGAVALGIFASRSAGLVREMVASRLLGNTGAADAFAVAMRIPNLLQNLLGEGVLSASLVPVYSKLLGQGDDKGRHEAGRVAGAVAASLMVVVGAGVLVIMALARPITFVLAPGLSDDRFELAVSLTRVTALGVGFAVLSAWCLGVLNSHRRFFLSYVAPVAWNAAQIAALVTAGLLAFELDDTARAMAWGVTVGGLLQLLVQLPLTLRLARGLRLSLAWRHRGVREVRRRFGPAVLGRGVVQLSAYLDLVLASLLAAGAVAALFRAQILYTLPVSLFAMSVAAAELPEMSRLASDPDSLARRARLGVRRVVFWMALAAAVYLVAGDLVVGVLFEGGEFTSADTVVVWCAIGAYAVGLPAVGMSRVLQNASYALGDVAGPARIAVVRVAVAVGVGTLLMFPLDPGDGGPRRPDRGGRCPGAGLGSARGRQDGAGPGAAGGGGSGRRFGGGRLGGAGPAGPAGGALLSRGGRDGLGPAGAGRALRRGLGGGRGGEASGRGRAGAVGGRRGGYGGGGRVHPRRLRLRCSGGRTDPRAGPPVHAAVESAGRSIPGGGPCAVPGASPKRPGSKPCGST